MSGSATTLSRGPRALRPGSSGAWWLAIRPRTLTASAAPIVLGTALAAADGRFRPALAVAALATAIALQVGSNLANDVFDFERGADGPDRVGPTRAAAAGLLSPRALRMATALAFAVAALFGLALVVAGGWPFALAGALAIGAAIAYTAGPWPLAYHGLGDAAAFVFFGLVAVGGSYAVQAEALPPRVLAAALPTALLVTAVLATNNLRDLDADSRAGKRTLAVRLGDRHARIYLEALLLSPHVVVSVLVALGVVPLAALVVWITAPLAFRIARSVRSERDPRGLDALLARCAGLHAVFTLLLAGASLA